MRETVIALPIVLFLSEPAASQAPQTFPFGLERLQWKMSYADVKAQLSSSVPEMTTPPIGAPHSDQAEHFWGPLHWKDCTLEVWTFFADDQLDYMDVKPPPFGLVSDSCKGAMQDELVAHYGETARNRINPFTHQNIGLFMAWKTPASIVSYGNGRVNLEEVGAPALTITDSIGAPATR